MKTRHENCAQDSRQSVPTSLWKPFLHIYFSFPVIRIWNVGRKIIIRRRKKRTITRTTSFRKLLIIRRRKKRRITRTTSFRKLLINYLITKWNNYDLMWFLCRSISTQSMLTTCQYIFWWTSIMAIARLAPNIWYQGVIIT